MHRRVAHRHLPHRVHELAQRHQHHVQRRVHHHDKHTRGGRDPRQRHVRHRRRPHDPEPPLRLLRLHTAGVLHARLRRRTLHKHPRDVPLHPPDGLRRRRGKRAAAAAQGVHRLRQLRGHQGRRHHLRLRAHRHHCVRRHRGLRRGPATPATLPRQVLRQLAHRQQHAQAHTANHVRTQHVPAHAGRVHVHTLRQDAARHRDQRIRHAPHPAHGGIVPPVARALHRQHVEHVHGVAAHLVAGRAHHVSNDVQRHVLLVRRRLAGHARDADGHGAVVRHGIVRLSRQDRDVLLREDVAHTLRRPQLVCARRLRPAPERVERGRGRRDCGRAGVAPCAPRA
eukprot:PhM_4_TR16752/c1_g2_i2/m.26749